MLICLKLLSISLSANGSTSVESVSITLAITDIQASSKKKISITATETPTMNYFKKGNGKPLLLLHGLGGSSKSWLPIMDSLTQCREVIALDLPGFGKSPAPKEISLESLINAVSEFLEGNGLLGVDAVGSSLGGYFVLELVRRKQLGAVVALSPGGFVNTVEAHALYVSLNLSVKIVRLLKSLIPKLIKSTAARKLFLAQLSANPANIDSEVVLQKIKDLVNSGNFEQHLYQLAYGKLNTEICPTLEKPLVFGWGKNDLVCFPAQAQRAIKVFPQASIHFFENCGHFPHWDVPEETVKLILKTTATYSDTNPRS